MRASPARRGGSRSWSDPPRRRAHTIALRRRKGTLGAIELLAFNLTEWGVHCVELRQNMVWNQHLNHQRPDQGGPPPYRDSKPADPNPAMIRQRAIRGGTVTRAEARKTIVSEGYGEPGAQFEVVCSVGCCACVSR